MTAILRVRDNNGNVVDIPAIKGAKGDKPTKGVDYFTLDDKQEIINDVIASLPVYNGDVITI